MQQNGHVVGHLIKICLSSYKSEEIKDSRAIAFAWRTPTKKLLRRIEGSEQKSIQDIIKVIKESEPNTLPTFVAKNLNKLLPVSFDYIDITTYLKELVILKIDIECIKTKQTVENDNAALNICLKTRVYDQCVLYKEPKRGH